MEQEETRRARLIVAVALGLPITVATVLGFLGSAWWVFDLAANFRPHYVVLLLLAAVIAELIVRNRTWAVVFAVAALLNVAVIAPYFAGSVTPAVGTFPTLRLLTFNVSAGNENRTAVVRWLDEQDVDVVFVHEWSDDWADAVVRSDLRFELVAVPPDDRTYGPAMLVDPDLPVRSVEVLRRGDADDPVIRSVVEIGGSPITLIAAHPRAPRSPSSAEARDDLLFEVARLAASAPGPVVVTGDLNATPWSHAVRRLMRVAGLEDSLRGHGLQPTWPAGFIPVAIPIDHVLHSDDLTTIDRSTGPSLGSSHRPVIATIGFAAEETSG